MSPYLIRKHTATLVKYGLLKTDKSRRVANKLMYTPLDPITEAEFRAIYKAEVAAFTERLEEIEAETEEDRARLREKQADSNGSESA
ncbi:hypothetical protein [Paenibacillus sp. 453mf]|uniref:hypothetical protein n=1 Tax=Paenibacillus sp. 453mf TaxID=1761874 RepID=UPI0008E8A4DB|nr:hypothetical protein [Paenibacillus sp. 453mf]SFS76196.1 hypothetical protein SAMN04488601_10345 [Paenibacillus sp. 453mf]